jgi:hypothetical protein
MTTNQPDRLDRMESLLERVINLQANQQEQMQVLINAALTHETRLARQDALIERLDNIIEQMIYREGRNGNEPTED